MLHVTDLKQVMRKQYSPLACPGCGQKMVVVTDSRPYENTIRRRRGCMGCGHRWTTYEVQSESTITPRIAIELASIRRAAELLLERCEKLARGELDEAIDASSENQ